MVRGVNARSPSGGGGANVRLQSPDGTAYQLMRREETGQGRDPGTARRWSMLAVSTLAQAASAALTATPAFLIPVLHDEHEMSLAAAGAVSATPSVGVMLTLIGWGYVVDRIGERRVLAAGLGLAAAFGFAAVLSTSMWALGGFLLLVGVGAASTNAASGRVVVGWFPPHRRGLAMGIRQMAQPIGVGLAAVTVPVIAEGYGLGPALLLPACAAALMAVLCAAVVLDPPRPSRAAAQADGQLANPYRGSSFLWRVHLVSVLLVVPQFTVWTYALVWLIADRGWSAGAAGTLVAVSQVFGAAGRMVAGHISDVVGSRMRPLRWVAVGAAATMLALGATDHLGWSVAVPLMVVATVVTVADNGLAFTSVAEFSGPFWSGRALGTQNTAQYLGAALVPPFVGAAIGTLGYPLAFALVALFPIVATPMVPDDSPAGRSRAGTRPRVGGPTADD